MSIKQKLIINIKLPNKDWELLKADFTHYFDKNGNYNFEKFKTILLKRKLTFTKFFVYHFESARLREIAENIKTYNNKKNCDIDFIIRN